MVRDAEIFVAVLGASNLTYAEATWTQGLPDWIGAHVRMFRFWGASPRLLVPDNLGSGVHKASFYDPEVNRSYGAMAAHYGVGVLPARPYHPKDQAKVEAGGRIAQFYLLGRLRNLTFFSLAECNGAITEILVQLNGRVMRSLGVSRPRGRNVDPRTALPGAPARPWRSSPVRELSLAIGRHCLHHSPATEVRATPITIWIIRSRPSILDAN